MKVMVSKPLQLGASFTIAQLAQIVGVSAHDVQRWISHELLSPVNSEPEPQFDFRQLTIAQSLRDLAASGATLKKLKRAMKKFEHAAPAKSAPVINSDGTIYARLGSGELTDAQNQLR